MKNVISFIVAVLVVIIPIYFIARASARHDERREREYRDVIIEVTYIDNTLDTISFQTYRKGNISDMDESCLDILTRDNGWRTVACYVKKYKITYLSQILVK